MPENTLPQDLGPCADEPEADGPMAYLWRADYEQGRPVHVATPDGGYPAADADGITIYENTHFETEPEAWSSLVGEADAWVAAAGRRLADAEQVVAVCKDRCGTACQKFARIRENESEESTASDRGEITAAASEDPAIPEPDGPWNLQMLIDGLGKCDTEARITVRGGLNPSPFYPYAATEHAVFRGAVAGRGAGRVTVLDFLRMAADFAAGIGGPYEASLVWYGGYGRSGVVGLHLEANGDVTIQTKDFG